MVVLPEVKEQGYYNQLSSKLSEAAKPKIDLPQEASSRHLSIQAGSCFFAEMKWTLSQR
jgi:hypothetical protein